MNASHQIQIAELQVKGAITHDQMVKAMNALYRARRAVAIANAR